MSAGDGVVRHLEEIKTRISQLKAGASTHEKALIDLVADLIGHLEFLPDHTHHLTSGNSLHTEGPEDTR